jgi:hypothetical protein
MKPKVYGKRSAFGWWLWNVTTDDEPPANYMLWETAMYRAFRVTPLWREGAD